jgi:hypothetical protein
MRAVMHVRVSDPELLRDLLEFLGHAMCSASASGPTTIRVELPGVTDPTRARRELELFLAAWMGLHPRANAAVLAPELVATTRL